MSTYELTVDHVDEHVMETTTPSGHTVTMDSSPEPGGQGATPIEMLLASAGACSLIDVVNVLDKKRADFEELRVDIQAERREDNPRRFTAIELTYTVEGDVDPKQLEQACELSVEKYCSVLDTIRASPDVGWSSQVR